MGRDEHKTGSVRAYAYRNDYDDARGELSIVLGGFPRDGALESRIMLLNDDGSVVIRSSDRVPPERFSHTGAVNARWR